MQPAKLVDGLKCKARKEHMRVMTGRQDIVLGNRGGPLRETMHGANKLRLVGIVDVGNSIG